MIVLGGVLVSGLSAFLGYYLRFGIAKKKLQEVENQIQKLNNSHEKDLKKSWDEALKKSEKIITDARQEASDIRKSIVELEKSYAKRERELNARFDEYEKKRAELRAKAEKVKELNQKLQLAKEEEDIKLQKIAELSKEQAKEILLKQVEKESERDVLEHMKKIEREGKEKFEEKAKNIMVYAMQRFAQDQTNDHTTSTIALANDDLKGKIIGKEGRNIKALESLTGVQILVDEVPDGIVLSSFDPVRRNIAKIALEKLLEDGRIQPAKIEEFVKKAKDLIHKKIQEAGEAALYDLGITGIDPKLVYVLGRLRFRTSYGQNVLMHSIEVAHLSAAMAAEIGGDIQVAKMAGLFHDIGKALDHEIEGTHVEIGRALLKKYGLKKEIIQGMQSHHEEHPYETLESRIIQAADALSAARPGARRDTVDNYLKRLGELETIANEFEGVERSYAINAGRELRIFVKPNEISDLQAKKIARQIAQKIEENLRYPGEIKVTMIREMRVIDFAR
jgi:ribonuclease Y